MLAEERARLHPVPAQPHTVAFGVTRTVPANTPMVTFEGGQYSVPHPLLGQTVWVRVHGRGADEQVVIVHVGDGRAGRGRPPPPGHARAARRSTTSTSRPPRPARWTGHPRPRNAAEAAFLALGDGARLWLGEAAAAGTTKMRVKMAQARRAGQAVRPRPRSTGRSGTPRSTAGSPRPTSPRSWTTTPASRSPAEHRAGEDHSLTQGTAGWAAPRPAHRAARASSRRSTPAR